MIFDIFLYGTKDLMILRESFTLIKQMDIWRYDAFVLVMNYIEVDR